MPIAQLHAGIIADHSDRRGGPQKLIHLQDFIGKIIDDSNLLQSQGAPVGEEFKPFRAEKSDVSLSHHRALFPKKQR